MVDSHGGRVDARAKATDGALFDIEVQLQALKAMNARSWFYGSGLMGEEFKEGMPYEQMPKFRAENPHAGERKRRSAEELTVYAGSGLCEQP